MRKSVKDYCNEIVSRYEGARQEYTNKVELLAGLSTKRKATQADNTLTALGKSRTISKIDGDMQEIRADLRSMVEQANNDFARIRDECKAAFAGYYAVNLDKVNQAAIDLIRSNMITSEELLQLGKEQYKYNTTMQRIIAREAAERASKLNKANSTQHEYEMSLQLHEYARTVSENHEAHMRTIDSVIDWSKNALYAGDPVYSAAYAKNYTDNVSKIIAGAPDIASEIKQDGSTVYYFSNGVSLTDKSNAYNLQ